MRIATFNINNVNKRLANLLNWMAESEPDVICLQELRAEERAFPLAAIEAAGYGAVWQGQRTWNGVAILARGATPVLTRRALPGDPADHQARYIEAAVNGVLVASIYLPNGNPQPGPKFAYKLAWFDRLITHAANLAAAAVPVVLVIAIAHSCCHRAIACKPAYQLWRAARSRQTSRSAPSYRLPAFKRLD